MRGCKGTVCRMACAIFRPRSWNTGFSSHWRALVSKCAASSLMGWVLVMMVNNDKRRFDVRVRPQRGSKGDKNNKCHIPHEMDDYRRHPTPTDDFEIFRDVYYRGADDILAFRELISEYRFGFPNRG